MISAHDQTAGLAKQNWMQYSASHVATTLACFMHAYIHIRYPCNPPSENPGYRPDLPNPHYLASNTVVPTPSPDILDIKCCPGYSLQTHSYKVSFLLLWTPTVVLDHSKIQGVQSVLGLLLTPKLVLDLVNEHNQSQVQDALSVLGPWSMSIIIISSV